MIAAIYWISVGAFVLSHEFTVFAFSVVALTQKRTTQ
jgi:hypothetical protein